ncbi:hypothetical protein E4U51_004614 [Claviceps purpurea]|nr:hypothetical protein E4U51_004614 [Claviceps purpurea]
MESRVAAISKDSNIMRPTKGSLSQHLKKFHADIYNLQCSTKWTNYGICQEHGTELRAGIKIRQALRDHLEAHGFVSKSSYSSVSTLRSLISYDGLFSNISTKTPSPRTLSAKKNGPPMPLKNLSMPLSIDHSSADNTFDDNQADALDEDTSNASVECSAENAES